MEERTDNNIFRKLKEDLTSYIELKLEFLKLSTYERMSKVIATLSYGLIILAIAFFAFLFIFLALGFFLDRLLDSPGAGFLIVSVVYAISLLLVILNKKRISEKIQNEIIAALTTEENKDSENKENESNDHEKKGQDK